MAWSEGNTGRCVMRAAFCSGGVREPCMRGHFLRGNRETSGRSLRGVKATVAEIAGKVNSRNPVIGSPEESDGVIVPEKSANNGTAFPAESMEGRTPAERKSTIAARLRTQSRSNLSNGNRWLRRRRRRDGFRRKSLPTSSVLKVGATCGSSARVDLCGGHPATGVPTATLLS